MALNDRSAVAVKTDVTRSVTTAVKGTSQD